MIGVSDVTLWRWRQQPAFADALRRAQRQVMSHATGALQAAMGSAVTALRSITEDLKAPAAARVMACRSILELACKAIEREELEERLTALEEATNQNQERRGQLDS